VISIHNFVELCGVTKSIDTYLNNVSNLLHLSKRFINNYLKYISDLPVQNLIFMHSKE